MSGPLSGVKVLEVAGIGPGPFGAMLLADMGADVVRLDRASDIDNGTAERGKRDLLRRNRKSLAVDLQKPEGVEMVLKMCETADVIMEGFRPGVMERLGLGPDVCMARNPKLIYGRMTGWGQDGPMSQAAGHDINYISLSGALHAVGRKGGKPTPALNLIGDNGGGGMLLAFGIACALAERATSGVGQVIDAAMIEGSAILMAPFFGSRASGQFSPVRGENMLDGGTPFYDSYETADGKYISIGSLEPQFYALMLKQTGLEEFADQHNKDNWPRLNEELTRVFKSKTRDEWREIMEGTDACFAPVLELGEAPQHPHNVARQNFVDFAGIVQPTPAPRFSRTPGTIHTAPPASGQDTDAVLEAYGLAGEAAALRAAGAIR